jgi:hypothetical protein
MTLFKRTVVALVLVLGGFTLGYAQVLYTLESPNPEYWGEFGCAASGVGDVNNEGFDDVLIGAYPEDGGAGNAGRAYVFSGDGGGLLYQFESPNAEAYGWFGCSVTGVGDVDADGYDDFAVGASSEAGSGTDAGRVYVFGGSAGQLLLTLESPNWENYGEFGWSVAGNLDINNDGRPDIVVGAHWENGGAQDAGRAYVFDAHDGTVLLTLESPIAGQYGHFGYSVSGAGDVDGDGHDDVIVGAYGEAVGGTGLAGRAYVFSGSGGGLLYSLEPMMPQADASLFGRSVSGAGDVDGDGHADVIVGSPGENVGGLSDVGRAYVFSGSSGGLLHLLDSPNPESDGIFGRSVCGADDIDGDGHDDVVVAARGESGGAPHSGRAYLFSGQGGNLLYTLESPNPSLTGRFGSSVACAGDVNGDGCPDVLVGAMTENGGAQLAGRAYVFNGVEVPVELASLTCRPTSGGVLLEWATYTETDNRGFHVDRSAHGGRQRITEELIPGAGTTTIPQTYTYLDPIRDPGRYLYWLEQVDIDGSTAWHGPVVAVVEPKILTLDGPFPNPTAGEVRLTLAVPGEDARHVELRLYDTAGRLAAIPFSDTVEDGASREITWHPTPDVAPGLYWWRLTSGGRVLKAPMALVR